MSDFIVNENQIYELLSKKPPTKSAVQEIFAKALTLERLTLAETAALINLQDPALLPELFGNAKKVKEKIYGNRMVIFTPLYVSSFCQNECLYCAFRQSNRAIKRAGLSQPEIKMETEAILSTGQKRILLVAGEGYPEGGLRYILDAIATVYSARDRQNNIRRLNVNLAPVENFEFKELKKAGIGTYQLFQETYHRLTFLAMHLSGPKSDYNFRLQTIGRAFEAGIDDVGLGVLFGLHDWKFEVLALLQHVEYLEKKYGLGPHTISVPRLESAAGSMVADHPPAAVSDVDFKKIIAILRLSIPYTGIILSTRENPALRCAAFSLGISQISAGSRTNPGGYAHQIDDYQGQFSLGDNRSLDDVVLELCQEGYIPSFCTSCYRLGRTGLDFMELAKPGQIKERCQPNALITFQEYLTDYASEKVKVAGQRLLVEKTNEITNLRQKDFVVNSLKEIQAGKRDLFC